MSREEFERAKRFRDAKLAQIAEKRRLESIKGTGSGSGTRTKRKDAREKPRKEPPSGPPAEDDTSAMVLLGNFDFGATLPPLPKMFPILSRRNRKRMRANEYPTCSGGGAVMPDRKHRAADRARPVAQYRTEPSNNYGMFFCNAYRQKISPPGAVLSRVARREPRQSRASQWISSYPRPLGGHGASSRLHARPPYARRLHRRSRGR